jgi:hypothetical protein
MKFYRTRDVSYSDTLATWGMARVLEEAYGGAGKARVRIRSEGGCFLLEVEGFELSPGHPAPLYPYVKVDAGKEAPAGAFDYEEQKKREREFQELQGNRPRGVAADSLDPDTRARIEAARPHRDLPLFKAMRALKGLDGWNSVHMALRSHLKELAWADVVAALDAWAPEGAGRRRRVSARPWTELVSALSMFNPECMKGTNRLKPDGVRLENQKSTLLDEWLKYVGFYSFATAQVGKDFTRIVVVCPQDVDLSSAQQILERFRARPLALFPIKGEIFAVLQYTQTLLEHFEAVAAAGSIWEGLLGRRPRDVVAGLQVAFFESMGKSSAVTRLSFLSLPGWFPVSSRQDAEAFLSILEEHKGCVATLDERHSDEVGLLHRYREFLSSEDLWLLLDFLVDFGSHVLRKMDRRPRQFTIPNVERQVLGMKADLEPVVTHDGFRNVARAIRKATVSEQYWKSKNRQVYEVHYGLFQELKRKCRFRDEFVAALSGFIQEYNAETARAQETGRTAGRPRPRVTTEDLDGVIQLIDRHGSELVGMLLLAYGSARESQEAEEAPALDETKSVPATLEA